MALTAQTGFGTGSNKNLSGITSAQFTANVNVTAPALCIITYGGDNITTSNGSTSDYTVSDSVGNSWIRAGEYTMTEANNQLDGATAGYFYSKITNNIVSGSTVFTLTSSLPVTSMAFNSRYFSMSPTSASIRVVGGQAGDVETAVDAQSIDVSATGGSLRVRACAGEIGNGATFTPTSGWTAIPQVGTSGAPAIDNIQVFSEFKVTSNTTDASDITISTACDNASSYNVLGEVLDLVASGAGGGATVSATGGGGTTIVSGDGSTPGSAGTSAVAGTAILSSNFSSANGLGTSSIVTGKTLAADFSGATGVGTSNVVGAKIIASNFSAATGTGTSNVIGHRVLFDDVQAAGVGTSNVVGFSWQGRAVTAAGLGTTNVLTQAIQFRAVTAAGLGTTNVAPGFTLGVQATASGFGTSSVQGTGIKSANASTAAGIGSSNVQGALFFSSQAQAAGTSSTNVQGRSFATGNNSTATGVGVALAQGSAFVAIQASASGTGTSTVQGAATSVSKATAVGIGSSNVSGFEIVFLSPDADNIDGSWTNETGGTILVPSVDEPFTPNDTDYIQSSLNPVNDICNFRLSDPIEGALGSPIIIRYRYQAVGAAGLGDLHVRLLQGTTPIATWDHLDVGTSLVTAEQTLTAPQVAAITDFFNLFIEFNGDKP
jgi:hypothetical protein